MPDIDYKKLLEELKDAVVLPVKERAGKFLDDNKDAADFLEDRAKRLAELGVELAKAVGEPDEVERVANQIRVVRQSIQNELSQVAVNASFESKSLFSQVLGTALDVFVKALPVIIAAI